MKIRFDKVGRGHKNTDIGVIAIVFLLMLFSNGMFARINVPASICALVILSLPIIYSVIKRVGISFKKNSLILIVTLYMLQLITCLFNGVDIERDGYLMVSIFAALLFCTTITFEDFIKGYRIIIYWISLISTIIFYVNIAFPFLINSVPSFFIQKGSNDATFTVLWSFVVKRINAQSYNRNFGIFIEPGQFQIFLCIGLLIEFFYCKKIEWKRIIVLAIAFISCQSTNGFLALVPIVIAYLLDSSRFEDKTRKFRRILIMVLIVLFGIMFVVTENEYVSLYVQEILAKIENMNVAYSYEDTGTGLERRRSIDVAWKMFKESPIIGLGFKGWMLFKQKLTSHDFIMTFSPLNWFARFGILYGLITNVFYVSSFAIAPKKMRSKLMVIVGLLITISAQEITSDPFIWVLIFYGFRNFLDMRKKKQLIMDI